ncbi:MAG TPA: ribonuclease P protein component [Bacteroidales bacterium]|nr:ribonuclease P protein component [Bacteroidales bacterium]HOR60368.1 ribonuclease P protein component [Bacteroidales bacterium]HPL04683.1 ribonuclease P protein component [Bacteroidales bacterium]
MSKLKNKFKRKSFLKLKSEIQSLFNEGEKINTSSFRLFYYFELNSQQSDLKLFVSAPKKLLKSAVKRNIAKRRFKEAFRLNCHHLKEISEKHKIKIFVGIIHNNPSLIKYNEIEKNLILSLQKIYTKIYEKLEQNS